MARAPQVEFPGKKRQKVRMRGSKHANQDTQQKIKRSLAKLLENPEDTVPKMVGKLPRGIRKHPLQRSFDEIAKVNAKKNNVAWLAKRWFQGIQIISQRLGLAHYMPLMMKNFRWSNNSNQQHLEKPRS